MSLIVPWNDPGGESCCCEEACNYSAGPNSNWVAVELTPTQYALLYAGGEILLKQQQASYSVAATLGCNRQDFNASSTYPQTSINSATNACIKNNSGNITASAFSATMTSEIVSFPCNRVFESQTTQDNSAVFFFNAILWNTNSPLSFQYGVSINVSFTAAAQGTVFFENGVSIRTLASMARRTGFRSTPSNASGGYGAAASFLLETNAGTITIPAFNHPTWSMVGVAGTATDFVGTNTLTATELTLSPAAP